MEKIPEKIAEKLPLLPDHPGIYLWKNAEDEIIYIGKAKSLKNRVTSYFSSTNKDIKTEHLLKYIADLDYILVPTEQDAFILEANLIKRYKPKYNVLLKDDKRYPFVKITLNEPFPRIIVTRDYVRDGSRYFGPFTDTKSLRMTLRNLEWIFPVRTCSRQIPADRIKYQKACINYQLGKCPAPCIGAISQEEYMQIVKRQMRFLEGHHDEILEEFKTEMNNLSEELKFEEAAKLRDRIQAIEHIQKRQVVYSPDSRNTDVIGFYQEENIAICVVLRIVNGMIINKEDYPLANVEENTPEEILAAFLKLYYSNRDELPDEILLPFEPSELEELNEWLQGIISIPKRGEKSQLVAMAKNNAFHLVEEHKLAHLRKANRTIYPIQELKEKLGLPKLPRKMVCLDISTIQGTDTVASAVFFENGKPKKKSYRHFIIKTLDTQNDYAALQETLTRYLKECEENPEMLPDLFIIDGGKGQLNACLEVLNNSNYPDIPIISLAKRIEEIFLPNNSISITLPRSSSALRLLIAIRDEAHRFAITFHRSRRSRRTLISELEEISGIGEQTKFLLLKELGSVEAIKNASPEKLNSIKGIGPKTAEKIYSYFHPQDSEKG
ncbi:excinuclease ABC subunit UvrC [Candidatus Syntrophosphaera thermopropionivorans]|uniref:Excinuclease ABC subunit UvrC n=1 Tax=Candidatus Syntrophosphaera thermopropionivorans TaxID=2593015 RepID=A0AC61QIL3_9BACT|nr:excinuclease ABC subunit UvrC [Candidatus Syntrophosphaera thermopropionivorans]TDF72805.1 excinuclease ABC subunit UvrC [Candidatus Syntrophosphaera thermopropionivorans]